MKITLIIILAIIALLIIGYTYYGGFKKINISIAEQGGETVVFEAITGDYRQSGVVMDKIYYALLNNDNIETFKGYGKYFDDPKKVEKAKLRSEAGCIIEPDDFELFSSITGGYDTKVLPTQKYIVTDFPYKGKMSVMFSIMKVYPALVKYAKTNGISNDGAVIEICDVPNGKIMYRKEMK